MLSLFTSALLTSQVIGSTYYVSTHAINNAIKCTDGPDSICNIHCDERKQKELLVDCDNAKECNFYCEEFKCAETATIISINSNNLHVFVNDNANECMKNAIIQTPNYGNATFDMGNSTRGFRGMMVYSGENAQNIIINAESTNVVGDDCKDMKIYASTAKHVQISLGDGINWNTGILECPIYTNYYQQTPCMIYGSNAILENTHIIAYDGIPKNIYIEDGITYLGTNTLTCHSIIGTDVISVAPFDVNSECRFTLVPTMDPTVYPTYIPTYSMFPTDIQSTNLLNTDTLYPTQTPTQTPTSFTLEITATNAIVTEADSNSVEEELITTSIINSYSSKNKNIYDLIIENINITWVIIAVLILTVWICGCCLCYYICCANKHKKTKISQKEDPIDENIIINKSPKIINKSPKNNSKPVLDFEPKIINKSPKIINKYTVPEKCQIFVPYASNSSAASMISKSGNYSNYSSDSYANTFNIAASPSLFSYNHNETGENINQNISPHLSSNNSVGSYVNYNQQSKSLQQYQLQQIMNQQYQLQPSRARAVSYQNNMQPIYHQSNYNKQSKSYNNNSNAVFIPPPPPLPIPMNVFSPSESAPRPSPFNSNLLNALPPPVPAPESVSTNGGGYDMQLNEHNEGDTDNEYISDTTTNTDSECNSKLKFNKDSIHSSKSLYEQKTEELECVERIKNKSLSRMKVFKPPNVIYSALPQTICDEHQTENSQATGTMIINDSYSEIQPGSANHKPNHRIQTSITIERTDIVMQMQL